MKIEEAELCAALDLLTKKHLTEAPKATTSFYFAEEQDGADILVTNEPAIQAALRRWAAALAGEYEPVLHGPEM